MKTRQELIKNCRYSSLPNASCSLHIFFNKQNHDNQWVGGQLTVCTPSTFTLAGQSCELKCTPSPNCYLLFDHPRPNNMHKNKSKPLQKVSWKQINNLLKSGDSLSIQIPDQPTIKKYTGNKWEIKNIQKVILLSICKTKPLFKSSEQTKKLKLQKDWTLFLQWVQEALQKLNLQRVETPTIVQCPGTEPGIDVFETHFFNLFGESKNHHSTTNKKTEKKFLITSPEMHLKRLLCRGWTDIYEIAKCFRNNEKGPLNHTEFYMLEWYRAYTPLDTLVEDLNFLLNFLSKKFSATNKNKFKKIKIQMISVKQLFKTHLNMELTPYSTPEDFIQQLKKLKIPFSTTQDINDLFYLLFLNGIEPALNTNTPLVIYNYPPFQKAFARINNNGWANRFEFFWKSMELANAFDEVFIKKEQLQCFQSDLKRRRKNKKQVVPIDYKLLNDMEQGMPPASGIALGLDRLFLIFKQLKNIEQIRLF